MRQSIVLMKLNPLIRQIGKLICKIFFDIIISKLNFVAFKSPKKPTNLFKDFCPILKNWVKEKMHITVKFIYSEKATKFCELFNLLLSVCTADKRKVNMSQNFVTFSEYTNFKILN